MTTNKIIYVTENDLKPIFGVKKLSKLRLPASQIITSVLAHKHKTNRNTRANVFLLGATDSKNTYHITVFEVTESGVTHKTNITVRNNNRIYNKIFEIIHTSRIGVNIGIVFDAHDEFKINESVINKFTFAINPSYDDMQPVIGADMKLRAGLVALGYMNTLIPNRTIIPRMVDGHTHHHHFVYNTMKEKYGHFVTSPLLMNPPRDSRIVEPLRYLRPGIVSTEMNVEDRFERYLSRSVLKNSPMSLLVMAMNVMNTFDNDDLFDMQISFAEKLGLDLAKDVNYVFTKGDLDGYFVVRFFEGEENYRVGYFNIRGEVSSSFMGDIESIRYNIENLEKIDNAIKEKNLAERKKLLSLSKVSPDGLPSEEKFLQVALTEAGVSPQRQKMVENYEKQNSLPLETIDRDETTASEIIDLKDGIIDVVENNNKTEEDETESSNEEVSSKELRVRVIEVLTKIGVVFEEARNSVNIEVDGEKCSLYFSRGNILKLAIRKTPTNHVEIEYTSDINILYALFRLLGISHAEEVVSKNGALMTLMILPDEFSLAEDEGSQEIYIDFNGNLSDYVPADEDEEEQEQE